jgi:hypothetical protein
MATTAATFTPIPVTLCATCGHVGMDLSEMICPVSSTHGVLGEVTMTTPQISAAWRAHGCRVDFHPHS